MSESRNRGVLPVVLHLVAAGVLLGMSTPDVTAEVLDTLRTGEPAAVQRRLTEIRNALERDAYRWTPLMVAAADNPHPGTITMLIDAGEDPEVRSLDDWNALMFAAAFNQEPAVVAAILDAGVAVDGRTRDAWVAGYGAARYTQGIVQFGGLGDRVRLNGDAGDPDGAEPVSGWTALFFAARYNPVAAVTRVLLDAGANPHATDEHGLVPADYAREAGEAHREVAELLRDAP